MKKNSRSLKKSYELFAGLGIEAVESLGFQRLLWYLNPVNMTYMALFPPSINEKCIYVACFRKRMPAREKIDLWIFGWLVITSEGKLKFIWSYSPNSDSIDAYIRFEDFSTDWMEPLPNSVYRSIKADPIYRERMLEALKNPKCRWTRLFKFITRKV